MLYEKFIVSALLRAKTIKMLCWYPKSVRDCVIARVRDSGSHF